MHTYNIYIYIYTHTTAILTFSHLTNLPPTFALHSPNDSHIVTENDFSIFDPKRHQAVCSKSGPFIKSG